MNTWRVISALCLRAWRGTIADKGRLVDLLLFPISQLLIWGLFLKAGLVKDEVSHQLYLVNLIWAISATIQMQANRMMMFDLWAREFPELFRSGIQPHQYLLACLVFGSLLGLLSMPILIVPSFFLFGLNLNDIVVLLASFPVYYMASIALSCFVCAAVLRLSQTYGFLAWNSLFFIIMLSSPYVPVSTLPWLLRVFALSSPYGMVFEYVRSLDSNYLVLGSVYSLVLFSLSIVFYQRMFAGLRRSGEMLNI